MVERSLSIREVPGSMPGSSILKKCGGFYPTRRPFISQRRAQIERQSSISSLTLSRCSEIDVDVLLPDLDHPLLLSLISWKVLDVERADRAQQHVNVCQDGRAV